MTNHGWWGSDGRYWLRGVAAAACGVLSLGFLIPATGAAGAGTGPASKAALSCAEVADAVRLTYRVRVEPTATGQLTWIELRIRNTSNWRWLGATGGLMRVTDPDPSRFRRIRWGASSADGIAAGRERTSVKRIYNTIGEKLSMSATSRIKHLDVYTYVMRRRGGRSTCSLPARMRAPRCLSLEHPDGKWYRPLTPRERFYNRR